jgi:hypothetical protein
MESTMKIHLNNDDSWSTEVINDINSRIVTFLTENFILEEDEVRNIAQAWTEHLTVERN